MSKRGLFILLLGMLTVIGISVTAGIQSYKEEQQKQAFDQSQQTLTEQMTSHGWAAYEYHQLEESTVVLFSNVDETILGLGIMNTNGDFSASTRDTMEEKPFDAIHFGNTIDEYIGIRFNERPEDIVYVRLRTSDWNETYTVNDPQDEGHVRSYMITLKDSLHGDWTLETLDHHQNVLHAEAL